MINQKNTIKFFTLIFDMKKLAMSASSLLLGLLAVSMTSCGGSDSKASSDTAVQAVKAADGATTSNLNIRYIDGDSLMTHYNLAKDFQEASMRAVSKIEGARQAKATEIQKFAAAIEQKGRSNGYLTEASYNADAALRSTLPPPRADSGSPVSCRSDRRHRARPSGSTGLLS